MNRIITNTRKIISKENFNNLLNYNTYDWRPKLVFSNKGYHKTLIEEGRNYEMYLIGWMPCQKTYIHSHSNDCMFKILYGQLDEDIWDENNCHLKRYIRVRNDTLISNGIHSMSNNTFNHSVSLHIYEKPNI